MFSDLWIRVGALFRREAVETELDEELRFHLERQVEKYVQSGLSREEAQRRARVEFGGVELAKEECRDARGVNLIESLVQDLRFGLRMLRKSPGFTTAAVLTLALGIGANTAIFGLVDSAFLRGSPVREPERLVHIWTIEADDDVHTPTPAQYEAIRNDSKSFQQLAAAGWADYFYSPDGALAESLPGSLVTANWFPTHGEQPLLGRNFLEEEEQAGQDGVVILSYDFWHTRFHSDPNIIGQQIVLNRRAVTVVGVLPIWSSSQYGPKVFAPLILNSYASQGNVRAGKMRVQIVARLKPGVTLEQARSEVETIGSQFKSTSAVTNQSKRLVVEDFAEAFRHLGPTVQNARRGLWMTAVASGVVLLIACANVASLLLARGVKRHREVAVRAALGSSRGRMIRQLLTESTLLFLLGGVVALIATRWCQEVISKVASDMVSGAYLRVDGRMFVVSLTVSLLSALAFGLIPALHATLVNLTESLKDTAPNAGGGLHPRRLRNCLVGGQVALGMVLLVGFGLLLRSFMRVEASRLGYEPRNVLTATQRLPFTRYTSPGERARLMSEAVERMRGMSGIESVGVATSLPMEGADSDRFRMEAPSLNAKPVEDDVFFVSVSPDYFLTLRVPMLAGRPFREADSQKSSQVAIINQTFAKRYFPGINPIGNRLAFADSFVLHDEQVHVPTAWREIVGVVADFRQRNPEEDLRPLAYFPIAQTTPPRWSMAMRVRAESDMGNVAARLGKWLEPVDPQLYWELGSMQAQIHDSESLTLRRPMITLLASFGGLALVLVIVGVFGVTSYSVAERTREIGIRTALGAARLEIARLILRESLRVTLSGLAVGTFCAFGLTRFFPTEGIGWSGSGIFLYGVSRTDSLTYLSAAALLTMVVIAASWVPARRAMKVDPMVALRYE